MSALAAASAGEAREVLGRLAVAALDTRQRALVTRVEGLVAGEARLVPLWGDDALADQMSLRVLATKARPEAATARWEGFFWYAGRVLDGAVFSETPAELLGVAATAVASVSGYGRALELVSRRPTTLRLPASALATLQRIAMRCALNGEHSRRIIRWLLPRSESDVRRKSGGTPWPPALLALDAYRERGNELPIATLVAALVATEVRERLASLGPGNGFEFPHLPWGGPARSTKQHRDAMLAMEACRRSGDDLWAAPLERPWLEWWPSPDARQLEARLAEWIDGDPWTAREVLLCDATATAAVLGLMGFGERARAHLDAATVPDWLGRARTLLAEAVRTRPVRVETFWREPADRRWNKLRELLRSTEDPSVLLGTPHWLLPEGRGHLTTRLVEKGYRREARRLWSVLDNSAVRDAARPFWLLDEDDTPRVLELGEWLAGRAPRLGPYEALLGLERICRRLESEAGGMRH